MRIVAIGFVLLTSLSRGQSPDLRDRTFYLTHTATVQQFQEVATVIRTITDIQQAAVDNDQKSVTVHATAGQIAMAEWLFNELDNPSVQPSVLHEYLVPGSADDVVRLFYLTRTPTVQDFQEVATVVRTIANFRRAFTYNEARAYVVRGTVAQMGLAEWILKELEPTTAPAAHQYRMPGADDDVVGVMYLAHTPSVQSFQQAAMQIRETTRIQ
jgi:predicted RNA polymerase sigma factor